MNNCHGCSERKIGCHAVCLTYKAYQAKLNAQKASMNGQNDYDRFSRDAFWRRVRACRCL